MEIGEKDEQPKRKISVGFRRPQELEGDTIYVKLKYLDENTVDAEAISNIAFRVRDYSIGMIKSKQVARGDDSDQKFLEMLQQENNGEIVERYREDGLELSRLVQECLEIRIG